MGGRDLPVECKHGVVIDGGDFRDSQRCQECDTERAKRTFVLKTDVKHLLDVYIENGMVDDDDGPIIERLWKAVE